MTSPKLIKVVTFLMSSYFLFDHHSVDAFSQSGLREVLAINSYADCMRPITDNIIITEKRVRHSTFLTQRSLFEASMNPVQRPHSDSNVASKGLKYTISSQTDTLGVPVTKDHQQDQSSKNDFLQGLQNLFQSTLTRISNRSNISHEEKQQVVTLVDIEWLKTHEEVIVEGVHNLFNAIKEWNEYRLPLLVDCKSGAILDGHHRYHVGRLLGLSRLPVVLVNYLDDDTIDVDVWPECGIACISKEDVIRMSLSDKVFPPKTSKHGFVADLAPINIPLSRLV